MMIVGENPARYIANYSRQFMGDFLSLLRSTHGEKRVHANHFYASQYIVNKNHVHMNSTRWKTLTEFITFLGHAGICRVENTEKGWFISWIDTSPEAMKKRDANLKRERIEKGEADREDRLLLEQIERARQEAMEKQMEAGLLEEETKDHDVQFSDLQMMEEDIASQQDVKMEDAVQTLSSPEGEQPVATATPISITLEKPLLSMNQPAKSMALSISKPTNPLKSAMKKEANKEGSPAIGLNDNGKRPLPKAVEIMNEEVRRKKMREERDRYRERDYHRYDRPREVYVDDRR